MANKNLTLLPPPISPTNITQTCKLLTPSLKGYNYITILVKFSFSW